MTIALAGVLVFFFTKNFERFKEWRGRRAEAAKKIKEMMEGSENRPSLFALAKEYLEEKDFCQTIEFTAPPARAQIEQVKVKSGFAVAARVVAPDASEEMPPQMVSYISTERISYAPAWWVSGICIFIAFVCFMIMATVAQSNVKIAPIWEGACTTKEWHNKGFLSATLLCNGKETYVSDNETLVEMLNTGNPITCFESEAEKFYCLKSDQERKK